MKRILVLFFLSGSFLGCQTKGPKAPPESTVPPALSPRPPPSQTTETSAGAPVKPTEKSPDKVTERPRVALILGPGGMRSYAHAGVLQEVHRLRVPLVGIGGLEMGALPAALYAMKPQAFEAEWQMMKLKEQDFVERGLIGSAKPVDLGSWTPFLKANWQAQRIEDAKLPFACTTLNPERGLLSVVSRGLLTGVVPGCLSFPPFFQPYQKSYAGAAHWQALVDFFKAKGATHIIFVNVLTDRSRLGLKEDDDQLLWGSVATLMPQGSPGLEVLSIPLSQELTSFAQRREMIQKGKEVAAKALPGLLEKIGAHP